MKETIGLFIIMIMCMFLAFGFLGLILSYIQDAMMLVNK